MTCPRSHEVDCTLLDQSFKGHLFFLVLLNGLRVSWSPAIVWIFFLQRSPPSHEYSQVAGSQSDSRLLSYPVLSCTQVFAWAAPAASEIPHFRHILTNPTSLSKALLHCLPSRRLSWVSPYLCDCSLLWP